MTMPGFTADASLGKPHGRYVGHSRTRAGELGVAPQAETCDVGMIEGRPGLWIVCCDLDNDPPCYATGIV